MSPFRLLLKESELWITIYVLITSFSKPLVRLISWQLGQTAASFHFSLPGRTVRLGWKHLILALATAVSASLRWSAHGKIRSCFSHLHHIRIPSFTSPVHRLYRKSACRCPIRRFGQHTSGGKLRYGTAWVQKGWHTAPPVFTPQRFVSSWVVGTQSAAPASTVEVNSRLVSMFLRAPFYTRFHLLALKVVLPKRIYGGSTFIGIWYELTFKLHLDIRK